MKQRMTRAKRAKMAYEVVSRITYEAGFRFGYETERTQRSIFCKKLSAMIENAQNERDEARRELAELKARNCENCRLAPGCSYCVEGCPSCSEWEAKPEEK